MIKNIKTHPLYNIIQENLSQGKKYVFKRDYQGKGRRPTGINNIYQIIQRIFKEKRDYTIVNPDGTEEFHKNPFRSSSDDNNVDNTVDILPQIMDNEKFLKTIVENQNKISHINMNNVDITHEVINKNSDYQHKESIQNVIDVTTDYPDSNDFYPTITSDKAQSLVPQKQSIVKQSTESQMAENQKQVLSFTYIDDGKEKKYQIRPPMLWQFDNHQLIKYAQLFKFLFFYGDRHKHTKWDYQRVIELVVYNEFDEISNIRLTQELPLIFKDIWSIYKDKHPLIVYVIGEEKGLYYEYDDRKIEEPVVLQLIRGWITHLFSNQPPGNFVDIDFITKILKNIQVDTSITKRQLTRELPPGVAFRPGYVFREKGQKLLSFRPYDKNTFVSNTINAYPVPFIFENQSRELYHHFINQQMERGLLSIPKYQDGLETLLLSQYPYDKQEDTLQVLSNFLKHEGFQNHLRVLTESDPIKAVAIRSLIHRVVHATIEGRRYNQAYWLFGAPATSKSYIIKILQFFSNNSYVELSRNQNQFTPMSFNDAKLIHVSDINRVGMDMVDMLRKILGRDTMYGEIKHKTGKIDVQPFAQVVITSNDGPKHFPEIFTKAGFKDKITLLEFKNSLTEDQMIPDMYPTLIKYSNHYIIWGLFTPQIFLDQQVRAKTMSNYIQSRQPSCQDSYNEYIEERLVRPKRENKVIYVLKSELKSDLEKWIAENSLIEDFLTNKNSKSYLFNNLLNTLQLDYGMDIRERRFSENKMPGRPRIYVGIGLKSSFKNDPDVESFQKPISTMFDFHGYNPYMDVDFFKQTSLSIENIDEVSKKILKYREQINEQSKQYYERDND